MSHQSEKAKGLSLIGFLIILTVVGFFAYLGMRLIPIYSEYFSVLRALEQTQQEHYTTEKAIKDALSKRLYISYVSSVKSEDIIITRAPNGFTVNIYYEARAPFFHNVEFVATFDEYADISSS